ncbi:hypothetical protein FRC08_001951 [Ceratobasidium sp. 394]|nr:hypothetical protein FRC08_001951 [Ceratobasidium sp. 394]KAG9098038.1 hypothetical protein FS749_004872 [Ceratobasidium sp. UAMH 11750]
MHSPGELSLEPAPRRHLVVDFEPVSQREQILRSQPPYMPSTTSRSTRPILGDDAFFVTEQAEQVMLLGLETARSA